MDADERIKNNSMESSGIKAKIKKHFLDKCDLISTETNDVYLWLKENFYDNIKHIPFGVLPSENITKYDKKENTIITVGRIGTYQKATDILLEAYKRAYSSIHSWKLKIIGPIEKDFESEIDKFFTENPELKAKIEFAGPIFDREKLMKEYEKAKIFCLPSRYEGCPCVLTEAETRGCYIIASNMAATKDVTQNQKYGSLFEIDNVEELAEILKKICKNESKLKENCENVQKFVNENYAWRSVCKKALKYLEED